MKRLVSFIQNEIQYEQGTSSEDTLFQAIHPNMYENFIKAVFAVCGEEQIEEAAAPVSDADLLKAPSNAIKLSYDITKLCNMKMALSIHDEDRVAGEKNRKDSKRFMDLYRSQWEVDVKKKARHVLRERKLNMTVHLPDPADIEHKNFGQAYFQ